MTDSPNILWFKDIDKHDIPLVGGKGANLGEMLRSGFPVPDGFCVTAAAYRKVIEHNHLEPKIKAMLNQIDPKNSHELQVMAERIQDTIAKVDIPDDMVQDIFKAYHKLSGIHDTLVA